MVNFYNDYVTCSKTATISNVAGKLLLRPLQSLWAWLNINILYSFCVHVLYSLGYHFHHRSLWPYKKDSWGGYNWFWWRLRWRYKVVGKVGQNVTIQRKYEFDNVRLSLSGSRRVWRTSPKYLTWSQNYWGEDGLMKKSKLHWETISSVSSEMLRRWGIDILT